MTDEQIGPDTRTWDCLIVGGGPAGLTAAIYLARFTLSVLVVDGGGSRAGSIPETHNHAGFPEGISGRELLGRMQAQAEQFGAHVRSGEVTRLQAEPGGFMATHSGGRVRSRSVLIATGVVNRRPVMSDEMHDEALARGLLRYCPICDGFEVLDARVGVIGTGCHGANEAEFLRSYTADVTLIAPNRAHDLDSAQLAKLRNAAVKVLDGPCLGFELTAGGIRVGVPGACLEFASVYAALGTDIRSALAQDLGATLTEEGCIVVDKHHRTAVPGIYAAGDVVVGVDQISHAMGQAAVAATAIRNDLAAKHALYR